MSGLLGANPTRLCEQLARLWASRSAAAPPYTFADPFLIGSGVAAPTTRNIWARQLPPARHRSGSGLSLAASVVLGTGVAAEPNSALRAVTIDVTAFAGGGGGGGDAALGMLADLMDVLFPDGAGGSYLELSDGALGGPVMGQGINGVIGCPAIDNVDYMAPTVGGGTQIELWRVVDLQIQQEPTVIAPGLLGDTVEVGVGGGAAEMSVVFLAHPITLRGSRKAFDLLYSPGSGSVEVGRGTVSVTCVDGLATALVLKSNVGGGGAGTITLDLSDGDKDTIEELRDAVTAADPEWEVSGVNGSVDGVGSAYLVCAGLVAPGDEAIAAPVTLGVWPAAA